MRQKTACVCYSEDNLDIQNVANGSSVGGRPLVEGDRVLIRAQTDASENGIWVSGDQGLTRAADADAAADFDATFLVYAGNAVFRWDYTADLVVGTDDITFTQITTAAVSTGTVTLAARKAVGTYATLAALRAETTPPTEAIITDGRRFVLDSTSEATDSGTENSEAVMPDLLGSTGVGRMLRQTTPATDVNDVRRLIHPTPNYTSWLPTGILPGDHGDSFGGAGIWDPAAGVFRSYWHQISGHKVVMSTSRDGVTWGGRTTVLDPANASGGEWWESAVGVPYVLYQPNLTRPWVMFVRGSDVAGATYQIGIFTSTDGITWTNVDPNGDAYTGPIIGADQLDAHIDFGNCFHADGYYWLYWNQLAGRQLHVSRSADLVTWEHYCAGVWQTGSCTPTPIFSGVQDASGDWDYDDATHDSNSAAVNQYGYYCPWVGLWPREDGTREYRMIVNTQVDYDGLGWGRWGSFVVFTSPSPIFLKENRTYRGFVQQANDGTQSHQFDLDDGGHDVPRFHLQDWRQECSDDQARMLWRSVAYNSTWNEELMIRPATLPLACRSDDYAGGVLSGTTGLLPLGQHNITLEPQGDANTLLHYVPSRHGLVDLTGNGLHLAMYGGGISVNGQGLELVRATGGYALLRRGDTPTPFTAAITALTAEAYLTKATTLGAGANARVFVLGGDNRTLLLRLYGSAGDTACYWRLQIFDDGGTIRTVDSDTFDWSDGARMHVAVTWNGTDAEFWHDGALLSTESFAHTGGDYDDTNFVIWLGGKYGATDYWSGVIDHFRLSNTVRYGQAFTPAPPAVPLATTGYVYSGVYDFGVSVKPAVTLTGGVPAGTTLTVRYRQASSALDRSVTWADFQTAPVAGRYQQFAVLLTGDGTLTPSIKDIGFVGS